MSDATSDRSGRTAGGLPRRPLSPAKRMLLTTLVITFAVIGAIAVVRFVGQLRGGSGPKDARWDRIALVGRYSGAVTIVDRDGDVVESAPELGMTRGVFGLTGVHDTSTRLVVGQADGMVLDPTDRAISVDLPPGSTIRPLPGSDGTALVAGPGRGGNLVIVDLLTNDAIDVGDLAEQDHPLFFADAVRSDGTLIAIADAANFQTILIDRSSPNEDLYLPDEPIAVGHGLIATRQTIGRQAELALYGPDGSTRGRARTDRPVAATIDADGLLIVTNTGTMGRLRRDGTSLTTVATLTRPDRVTSAAASADRFVISGTVDAPVVDVDGTDIADGTVVTILDFEGTELAVIGGEPVSPVGPASSCVAVDGPQGISIVSLDDGEIVVGPVELRVTGWSLNGCAVVGRTDDGWSVASADGETELGRHGDVALAPDGSAVVTVDTDAVRLVPIDGDPVDLPDVRAPVVVFTSG